VKASANSSRAELEQAIAAPGLAVVVALGVARPRISICRSLRPKRSIDSRDLWLDRPLVRKEQPRRATLDDGRCNRGAVDIRERLGGEDDGGVLFAQRLQPFADLAGKPFVIEREPTFVDNE
jgi:hypothetical protein